MKLAVFSSYGSHMPTVVRGFIEYSCSKDENESFNKKRIKVAEFVNKHAVPFEKFSNNRDEYTQEWFFNHPSTLVETQRTEKVFDEHIKSIQTFTGYSTELKGPCSFSVYDIDTSVPWIFTEYDGSESIERLPEYELVDEELNLFKRKY